jgi:magnesium-transporting ATPase (P-type)
LSLLERGARRLAAPRLIEIKRATPIAAHGEPSVTERRPMTSAISPTVANASLAERPDERTPKVVMMELIVDPVCSIAFEAEPEDAAAMRRPPRPSKRSLFGRREIMKGLAQGVVVLAAALGAYAAAIGWGLHEEQARGLLLTMLITFNLALAFAGVGRSGGPLLQPQRLPFACIVGAAAIVMAMALYVPFASAALQIAPPPLVEVTGLAAALLAGLWPIFANRASPETAAV